MTNKILRYSLWLEGEFDRDVHETPGVSADEKYILAYEAAAARGCACTICDDTGLSADEYGPVIAIVHGDGEVTDANGTHQYWAADRIPALQKTYVKMVVLCTNSNGSRDFHTCSPEVTKEADRSG